MQPCGLRVGKISHMIQIVIESVAPLFRATDDVKTGVLAVASAAFVFP
jgi:hypothetical protein